MFALIVDFCDGSPVSLMNFDATLGFPGEGRRNSWSITTANVDSFAAHPTVLTWPTDVILMQETRIGEANKSNMVIQARTSGWNLHHGRPVPKLRMKNHVSRINHGGVAVMGKTGFLRPFEPPPTFENAWRTLHATCRVAGAWVQINANTKALVFSIYGVTRSSMCAVSARTTNDYLELLFEIAASFSHYWGGLSK